MCTAGSKTYVHEDIYDEFVKLVAIEAKKKTIGDPLKGYEVGPIVDKIQFDKIMDYIKLGKKEGAKLIAGGKRYGDKGYFIEPTVFADVTENHTICKEEIFGPCMSILKYKNINSILEKINNTEFGLAGAVVTQDIHEAFSISKELRAGTVWVNTYHEVYPQSEFGGFKQSGFGRDCGKKSVEDWTLKKTTMISKL